VGEKALDSHPGWGNPADEKKSQKGVNVRKTGGGSSKIGWLARGTQITIGDIKIQKGKPWGKIIALDKGEGMIENSGEFPAPDAPLGWVYLEELSPVAPTPKQRDVVHVLREPELIAAGKIVGHLGEYVRQKDVERKVKRRPLLHLEVFAGPEVPAFIGKSWARDRELGKNRKTF
jgi:hypothetical protein